LARKPAPVGFVGKSFRSSLQLAPSSQGPLRVTIDRSGGRGRRSEMPPISDERGPAQQRAVRANSGCEQLRTERAPKPNL